MKFVAAASRNDPPQADLDSRWLLPAVLLLGLVVRLLHFWAISGTAWPMHHLTATEADDYAFFKWAKTIIAGDWLGRDTYHPYFQWMQDIAPLETWYQWWGGKEIFHQAPLYPYLLAGLLSLVRDSVLLVFLTQLLIGALQPFVIYKLAAISFNRRVGLVAALLTALYGPFVFHQATLLRDWLPPIVEPLALWLLLTAREKGGFRPWGLAGAALGLAILTKESALLLAVFSLFWIATEHRGAWGEAGKAAFGVFLGFSIVLCPLLIRNVAVGAPVFALSNRAAEVFVFANRGILTPESLGQTLRKSGGEFGRAVKETVRTYDGDWGKFLDQEILKLQLIIEPFEIPNNVSYAYGQEISPVLRWCLGYGLVFPLGLAGLLLSVTAWRRNSLLILYCFATLITLIVTSGISRYRLSLVPALAIFAGVLLVRLLNAILRREYRQALSIFVLSAGSFLLPALLRLPDETRERALGSHDYVVSARAYASEKRLDLAAMELASLREKVSGRPSVSKATAAALVMEGDYRSQWAIQLFESGKKDEAEKQVALAEVAYAPFLHLAAPHYNLGSLYLEMGEVKKAKASFQRFLEIEPDNPVAKRARSILAQLDRE
ncbi:MAG: glycosyltransferase family 39 protein [Deltaproteobacteria bacterium]|nr:glycosyltransferase family 39 protein [Deltaproteobacteria bacterium]